jgi:ribosomal protein S18 acetylase RimI-like enzyme
MSLTQETTCLEAVQVDQAVATLTRAFQDDPIQRYVIPDDARRARLQPWVLGALVRYCLPYGEVHTTPDLDGVACWLPPGSSMTNIWGLLRSGMMLAPLRLGPVAFSRFMVLSTYMDATREHVVSVPHWYLSAIGVEPLRQGQGIGGALLDPVLARADADRLPCYLETQSERNVRFYEKRGFKVSHAGAVRGLRIWSMLRTPQGPITTTETQPEPPEKENS